MKRGMASCSSSSSSSGDSEAANNQSCSVVDAYLKLLVQIVYELRTIDVKVLKSLTVKVIPRYSLEKINPKEKYSGFELVEQLEKYRFISENNLSWFKDALRTANRDDLARRVEEFEKTVTALKDPPVSQMSVLPAPDFVLLRLLLTGQRDSLAARRIEELRESLCQNLSLKKVKVPIIGTADSTISRECSFVEFQIPNEKIDELNLAATKKEEWLLHHGVLQLKINDKATIYIDDNLQGIEPVKSTETWCLEMKPEFKSHQDTALDLILVIEVPFTVGINDLKNMLKQCQAGVTSLAEQGYDMRLAIVTYGDHCATEATQLTAFIPQQFSTDFDFADRIKNERQRGGKGGTSGIADAMAKVVELTRKQNIRQGATKLCILVNFLVQDCTDLKQYECPHKYDVIKLCGNSADIGLQLYILGINTCMPISQSGNQSKKDGNYFLEGIATLGGGRYFQLVDVTHLSQAIICITIHEMDIETQGKVTGEMIIQEINKNYGVVSVRLPRILEEKLQLRSIGFNAITENGKPLEGISQIAERVAWANDLGDAILAVTSMKRNEKSFGKPKDDSKTRSLVFACTESFVPDPSPRNKLEELHAVSLQKRVAAEESHEVDHQNTGICLTEKESVDLEVSVRIVRRQLHRMAYFKRSDVKDQNQTHVEKMDIEQ